MKETVTIEIRRAYPDARPVARLPFRSSYRLTYASERPLGWQHPHFSAVLQQHDAFDAYILLLEIRVKEPAEKPMPLLLPLTTHRSDLHWLYQLSGSSVLMHETGNVSRALTLGVREHRQLYSPQLWAMLHVQPDADGTYLLADVVVKEGWLRRYLPREQRRYSKTCTITPPVLCRLLLLFDLLPKKDFEMDAAIYYPVAELLNLSRSPAPSVAPAAQVARNLVRAVQELVVQQVAKGICPQPKELSTSFAVHPKKLRRLFLAVAGQSLQAYISDIRMQEAWRRLTEDKQPPAAVAFGLGYQEQTAFNHQFKRHFGITPSEARAGMLLPAAKSGDR